MKQILAGVENQASCSVQAQPGQHKDLYCRTNVVAAVASNYYGKDDQHEFYPHKFLSVRYSNIECAHYVVGQATRTYLPGITLPFTFLSFF